MTLALSRTDPKARPSTPLTTSKTEAAASSLTPDVPGRGSSSSVYVEADALGQATDEFSDAWTFARRREWVIDRAYSSAAAERRPHVEQRAIEPESAPPDPNHDVDIGLDLW